MHQHLHLSHLIWRIVVWGTLLLSLLAVIYAVIQMITTLNSGVMV